jgi:hypothetical protein
MTITVQGSYTNADATATTGEPVAIVVKRTFELGSLIVGTRGGSSVIAKADENHVVGFET